MTRKSLLLFIAVLVMSTFSFAQEAKSTRTQRLIKLMDKKLALVYQYYNQGSYQKTLDEIDWLLKRIKSNTLKKKYLGLLYYWKAMVYYKRQEYDGAIRYYEGAIKRKHKAPDLYYLYGQSLYAMDRLSEARKAFAASVKLKHRVALSLYYIGFSYQLEGHKKRAVRYYKLVEKVEEPESDDIVQAALAQVGDIYLDQILKQKRIQIVNGLDRFVFPYYERAIGAYDTSPMAEDLDDKIYELKQRYDLISTRMRNGRAVPRKRTQYKLTQSIRSDDNVVFQGNDTTTAATDISSLISITDVFGRYTMTWDDDAFIMPEARFNLTHHFNRDNPEVYANDNYSYSYGIRTSWEHEWLNNMASFLLDVTRSETYQDYLAEESYSHFNSTTTFIMGERFRYFDSGDTTIRYIRDINSSYDPTQDSVRNSIRFEQITTLWDYSAYFAISYSDFKIESETQNNRSFSFSGRIFLPPSIWGFAPTLGVNLSMTNPYNQKESRGTETLFNPTINLTKIIKGKYLLSLGYSYLNNSSKDTENYAFTKNIMSVNLDYFF